MTSSAEDLGRFFVAEMVCTSCGAEGHNIQTSPILKHEAENPGKRGPRASRRTPQDAGKFANLHDISKKLSHESIIPALPDQGAAGSAKGLPPNGSVPPLPSQSAVTSGSGGIGEANIARMKVDEFAIASRQGPLQMVTVR